MMERKDCVCYNSGFRGVMMFVQVDKEMVRVSRVSAL